MLHKVLFLYGFLALAAPLHAQATSDVVDGPGPNLVITVGGVTTGQIVIDLFP